MLVIVFATKKALLCVALEKKKTTLAPDDPTTRQPEISLTCK